MGWFQKLMGIAPAIQPPVAQAIVHEVPAALAMPRLGIIRIGMWVMTPEGMGIVAGFASALEAEVHLTDSNGLTVESKTFYAQQLSQAKLSDIPAWRQPDAARAEKLGYR